MCGIAVIAKRREVEVPLGIVRGMTDIVSHRGPDGEGLAGFDGSRRVDALPETKWTAGLGHRRLSIIDLTPAAAQPMVYRDRYWLVCNGEVYNYVELRSELRQRGHIFATKSDSEVILAAYAEWGSDCFQRFRGMWGLVLFDAARNRLTLSRDRLGIKPLYTWQGNGMLAVASEIKQFLTLPAFTPRRDEESEAEFLWTGYEDPSRTFFEGVAPVAAGTFIDVSVSTLTCSAPAEYWAPQRVSVSVTDAGEAAELFRSKLSESVRIHLRSDVPVGCALSGGLDSSAIASLADEHKNGSGPLQTFTATFPGDPIDERPFADSLISRIPCHPHFVSPSAESFLEDLRHFLWHQEEPVGGLSVYASYCVARMTRKSNVPVMLSGQGGDELLSGYWQSFFLYLRELGRRARVLALTSELLGALLPAGNISLLAQSRAMLRRYRYRRHGRKLVPLLKEPARPARPILDDILKTEGQERRIREIRSTFLPRLLKWDDRNSMAFAVEGRYPYLDHELIELCLAFAPSVLYSRGWTKWPLRRAFGGFLPESILWRRAKIGFEVPQDRWLCGPLRPEIERWLLSDRPIWEHVDRPAVRRLAEETWKLEGRQTEPGQALFRCFIYDRWLELFEVR